jgi:dolichol-phosphate mannosyltransferase
LFDLPFNDVTNAFKCYRREVIAGVQPILSSHFNLTVELPLKAIVRGYSYAVVPTNWYGRAVGISKLKIKEMSGRYLFIVLYVFLEKLLAPEDYRRKDTPLPLRLPDFARPGRSHKVSGIAGGANGDLTGLA